MSANNYGLGQAPLPTANRGFGLAGAAQDQSASASNILGTVAKEEADRDQVNKQQHQAKKQGTLALAAAGATYGSSAGFWGAAAGAVIGAVAGDQLF